jgi:hypothetical protein
VGPLGLYIDSRMERVGPPDKLPSGTGGPTWINYMVSYGEGGPTE